jgi:hypothetical protein
MSCKIKCFKHNNSKLNHNYATNQTEENDNTNCKILFLYFIAVSQCKIKHYSTPLMYFSFDLIKELWQERWDKCILSAGDYFEGDN